MAAVGTVGAKLDLLVRQSMTLGPYRVSVSETVNGQLVNTDLTGAVITGQVRRILPVQGSSPPADPFLLSLDIVRAPDSGLSAHQYLFGLSSAKTDSLEPGLTLKDATGKYAYDTQVTFPDGTVRPHLHGVLTVYREVTRP